MSSYSFLREGVELLNVCLDQSTHSTEEDQGESSTMSSDVASAILNEVLELTRAVEKMKIKSCTEYESARKRFEDARKEATKAFCNEALKIEDRIFASKLRVVSEILENLESPKTAITGCLSFLRDLHSLPSIRDIFSIYLNGGVKSLLGKEERAANVKSVMLINHVLFQFSLKFSSKFTDRVVWPAGTIELADRIFNPVLEWKKVSSRKSMGGELDEPPNELVLNEDIYPWLSAVNSQGEIIVIHRTDEIKIISRTGETKPVKLPEPREGEFIKRRTVRLAVDKSNNVYVVRCLKTHTETDDIITYVLHVLDDGYNVKHVGTFDFLEQINQVLFIKIAINENNDIIMIRDNDSNVYVCDNSGKLKHKFERDSSLLCELSVSNKNEVMISSHVTMAVKICTEEGNITSTIQVTEGHRVCGIAFHYVVRKIIVLTYVAMESSFFRLCYSEAGELESSTFFCCYDDGGPASITSHPAGPVAVVRKKSITFF